MRISPDLPCAMLKNVYLGVVVIYRELMWVYGPDRAFHRQLKRLEKQLHMLQCRLSELTVLAAPERRELEADLVLLKSDMQALTTERNVLHKAHLAPLQHEF